MPNRNLTPEELRHANELLATIRRNLDALSGGDPELLFAYRRKIAKELTYDERDKPAVRRRLKAVKRKAQNGRCPLCAGPLPEDGAVLDRFVASAGYTAENTRLICPPCDRATQKSRRYS